MPNVSDFRLGADVITSDGKKVGSLVSVIVDEQGFDPRALVVKDEESLVGRLRGDSKLFTTDEVVIPITAVESATHELVRLSMSEPDVRRQPLYLSYRAKPVTFEEAADVLTGSVGLPPEQEVANKPAGQIEIDRGENVMLGKTGHRLGRVEDVLLNHGEVIGVVIRPDGLLTRHVVLPMRFISRADDMALFADLDKSDIDELKPFIDGE